VCSHSRSGIVGHFAPLSVGSMAPASSLRQSANATMSERCRVRYHRSRRDNQRENRIASPEVLLGLCPLPHLKCSAAASGAGVTDGVDEHGYT
jgi:hypothetical protein